MVKRRSILGVVAAVAASIWIAPAASAQTVECMIAKAPPQNVVTTGGGAINVYPANAAPYVTAVASWGTGIVTCVVNEAIGPAYACVKAFVNNRPTVTIDPQTLQITIEYGEFIGTTCSLS